MEEWVGCEGGCYLLVAREVVKGDAAGAVVEVVDAALYLA